MKLSCKKEKTFVLPPMCICNKPPVKLSLQVRKAIGPWEMPGRTAGKLEGSSGNNIPQQRTSLGCGGRVRVLIHCKQLSTAPITAPLVISRGGQEPQQNQPPPGP